MDRVQVDPAERACRHHLLHACALLKTDDRQRKPAVEVGATWQRGIQRLRLGAGAEVDRDGDPE